ncbi:MAG: 16S rRNA (cytosine(1402)-N(4))-methyltransferase RsmH [Minisyncoccia bacterium]
MNVMRTHLHSSSPSGSASETRSHIPVLLHEVVDSLALDPTDIVFDGTLGEGGHGIELAQRLGANGIFCGVDADGEALERVRVKFRDVPCTVILEKENHKNIRTFASTHSITAFNKILLDLGWGTHTLSSARGFSFNTEDPLIMTYDDAPTGDAVTAYDVINHWSEETLHTIFKHWGEEPRARKIAEHICEVRKREEIRTSKQLGDIVAEVVPKMGKTHPATKVFQALRIAVNDEMRILNDTLPEFIDLLAPGGRLAIITFHSIEDRIVKYFFKESVEKGLGTLLHKKALQATRTEQLANPRSRSAKLRIFIKK